MSAKKYFKYEKLEVSALLQNNTLMIDSSQHGLQSRTICLEAKHSGKPLQKSEMLFTAHSSCFADSTSKSHTSRQT